MEIDEEARCNLLIGLETFKHENSRRFDMSIKGIGEAQTVEDIMRIKRELLVSLLSIHSTYPLTGSACYFCILHENDFDDSDMKCDICEYSVKHGICSSGDWARIKLAIDELKDIISEFYYMGETYTTVELEEEE